MTKSFVNIKHANRSHLYWGIDKSTGEIVEINEVQNRGLNCNCRCAACKGDFIAKKGEVNKHHFAHQSNYECVYANEIAIYLLAQKILSKAGHLELPQVTVSIGRRTEIAKNPYVSTYTNSYYQCDTEQYPPLLLGTLDKQPTRIILDFGHYYSDADYNQLRQEAVSESWDCIAITLPRITDSSSLSIEHLRNSLLHQIDKKRWIRNALQDRWKTRLKDAAIIPEEHLFGGKYIRYECPIHCQKDGSEYYANISDCDFCVYNLSISPDCQCLATRGIKSLHDFKKSEDDLQAEVNAKRKENDERLLLVQELRKQQQDTQIFRPAYTYPVKPTQRPLSQKYTFEEQLKLGREEVMHRFDHPTNDPVFDRFNTRWVKCTICSNIIPSSHMVSYGGPGRAHLGICRECSLIGKRNST